jgi:peptide deformylase
MTVLDIVTFPADILKEGAEAVTTINDTVRKLIEDMADTMYVRSVIGLAAVQVGSRHRVVVYDISEEREKREYHAVINPRILSGEGEVLSEKEGCLSVPEFRADVNRYAIIELEGQDRDGSKFKKTIDGFEATVLQHEIDHLNGVLILDHASRLKRELYKKKVKKWLQQA